MTEIESILIAYESAKQSGKRSALATVVHVDGSSYRRPGARMLITEDGELTGSISGGCLEGDALRKALHAIHSSKTMLVTYDTSDEDDAKFGFGLGCNGVIQVLIEPLDTAAGRLAIELLQKTQESRLRSALVTLFCLEDKRETQPGSFYLIREDGESLGDKSFIKEDDINTEANLAISKGKSSFKYYQVNNKEWVVFTEIILPPISIIIIGAGNDTIPLVKMADILGWRTTIVDGRPMYADKNRFPTPSCQVLHSKAENILQYISIDSRTVFVLMSHNYNYDLAILRCLLQTQAPYIGILGPKKKMNSMFEELEDSGLILTNHQKERIHGPVGIDIGAETSEEIALSIVAEIKSVLNSRTPQSLRDRKSAIHYNGEIKNEKAVAKSE